MSKSKAKSFQEQVAEQIRQEAMGIAKGIQRPGQTKEQTKLITQGIAKGIERYKKQHKEKLRGHDRSRKKQQQAKVELTEHRIDKQDQTKSGNNTISRAALVLSGAVFGLHAFSLFMLFLNGLELSIANKSVSNEILLGAGLMMLMLSISMFWARR